MDYSLLRVGLRVAGFSFQQYDGKDKDGEILIELMSDGEQSLNEWILMKVNLYDENGDIFLTNENMINMANFMGYDTIKIPLRYGKKALISAKKARIFATKR